VARKKTPLRDTLGREADLFEKSRSETKPTDAYRRVAPARDPSQVYSIRIPTRRLEELRKLADAKGVQPSVMIREWALERLEAESRGPTEVSQIAEEMMDAASRLRAAGQRL